MTIPEPKFHTAALARTIVGSLARRAVHTSSSARFNAVPNLTIEDPEPYIPDSEIDMSSYPSDHWACIGGGAMATAIIKGMVNKQVVTPENILVADPNASAVDRFGALGVTACADNVHVATRSDVIILAVKPHVVGPVLEHLAEHGVDLSSKLLVSIAAGVTLDDIAAKCAQPPRGIVRVMPNTPMAIGAGAAGLCGTAGTAREDLELIADAFNAFATVHVVPERLMDAVTALAGSGPALVYAFIEALSDGGVRNGLPRDVATSLAAKTVAGAAQMVMQTGEHPGVLKDQVTSPGGTTIAALHAFEDAGVRGAVMSSVKAAADRAKELR